MKRIILKKYLNYAIIALLGLFLGWLFFHPYSGSKTKTPPASEKEKETLWTCAMHPQIRQTKPGNCPICGMELIPLNRQSQITDSTAVYLSHEAAELANVETSIVSRHKAAMEIRLYGKIQADERLLQSQTAHVPGRIEKLNLSFTGEEVKKGQTLATIYSPELTTAEQELLQTAAMKENQPELYEASKERLRQWKLTDAQIEAIEASGKVSPYTELKSDISGIVTARRVSTGDYVNRGTVLFDIANLSNVWVLFDAYESDLTYLNTGSMVTFTVQALPGENFTGKISFIDPVIDPVTRVSRVRVELNNRSGKLKPEMFATGVVKTQVENYRNNFIIPRSAVLWTGKRSIVYVKKPGTEEPVFSLREITLGPSLGNSYVVLDGLSEGEVIVTNGTFSIDAAAQLEGKPSMMNMTDSSGSQHNTPSAESKENKPDVEQTSKISFTVSGNCDLCKERIEKSALSVAGVSNASWNVGTKKITVAFNKIKTTKMKIEKAIAASGHDTEDIKAGDAAYNALPACCKYRSKSE